VIRWELPDGRWFELDATFGKPLDVLTLKGTSLADVRDYAAHLAQRARELYGPDARVREVAECPCCGNAAGDAEEALRVFDVPYHRCSRCGHGFVRLQPAAETLVDSFAESEELSATYTDPGAAELRVREIAAPKLQWALDVYRTAVGGAPTSMIDVGAGGGHFVAACARAGLAATGYELSRPSRAFALKTFGVELEDADFTAEAGDPADLVTLWGVLEYAPEPRSLLASSRERLTPGRGMLVVEVPRFDCLGTAVQRAWPDLVARHLDPTSHLNCFSDASLAAVLDAEGFRPVACWYFGMDAYELLVQLALRLGGEETLAEFAEPLLSLQPALDGLRLCDDVVAAAVPV
jgi:hypothetical protein